MTQELWKVVGRCRDKGMLLSDCEAEKVCCYCYRKMEAAGIREQEEYLPVLYENELRDYLLRRAVNATTVLQMIGKEMLWNVYGMYADAVSPQVPKCLSTKTVIPV